MKSIKHVSKLVGLAVAASVVASASQAVEWNWGDFEGQLDSSISLGASWRAEDADPDLIGIANGGRADSVNYDDGQQNFQDAGDLYSLRFQGTHELALSYKNYGAFIRGRYWYDHVIEQNNMDFRDIPDSAVGNHGMGAEFLDFFVYADWYIGDKPLTVRVGEQVVSWGESLFMQGGINIMNPFDVSALRSPGTEIKDAFLPTGKVYFNFGATENFSIEGYLGYDWERTRLEPCGTYFSPADYLGSGCNYAFASTEAGTLDNPGDTFSLLKDFRDANLALLNGTGSQSDVVGAQLGVIFAGGLDSLAFVTHYRDTEPDDSDLQYGIAARLLAPSLNNTEFGFYYSKYHSTLPFLSPWTPEGLDDALFRYSILGNITTNATDTTGDGIDNRGILIAVPAAANYNFVYPEDIDVFGFSFSTTTESGLAIAGEWSYRPDMPVQLSLPVFLARALYVERDGMGGFTRPFQDEKSYIEMQKHQFQVNFIYSWSGKAIRAGNVIMAAEVGAIWLPELEDAEHPLFYEDGTTRDPGDHDGLALNLTGSNARFADDFSWGYQIRAAATYNNVVSGLDLVPQISWQHDVEGVAPGPGPTFIQNRKALGLRLTANYMDKYSASIGYTRFMGTNDDDEGQEIHQYHDRDLISASFRYRF